MPASLQMNHKQSLLLMLAGLKGLIMVSTVSMTAIAHFWSVQSVWGQTVITLSVAEIPVRTPPSLHVVADGNIN